MSSRLIPVERVLAGYCKQQNLRFSIAGDAASRLVILSPEAFLPIVALHAEMAAYRTLLAAGLKPPARPLDTQLQPDEEALFKIRAGVAPLTGDGTGSFRGLMFIEAFVHVFGEGRDRLIECEGLYERYRGEGLQRALRAITDTSNTRPAS